MVMVVAVAVSGACVWWSMRYEECDEATTADSACVWKTSHEFDLVKRRGIRADNLARFPFVI